MKELSLLETLERAHLLSEIQDPSPMVEYSVYRLLIVFLMDMLRPEDEEVLEELLDEVRFSSNTLRTPAPRPKPPRGTRFPGKGASAS